MRVGLGVGSGSTLVTRDTYNSPTLGPCVVLGYLRPCHSHRTSPPTTRRAPCCAPQRRSPERRRLTSWRRRRRRRRRRRAASRNLARAIASGARSRRSASASASSWVMFTGGARWTGGGTAELLWASRSAPAYLEPFLQKTIASLPRGIGRGDREGTTRQRSGGKTMRSCRSVPGSFLLGRERPGNAIFAVQNCIKTASSSPDAQIVGNGLFPKAKSNKS